ncbi:MAG: hypothetical protein JSR19_10325 [Proteobacteria bacterium]|nr:hypothetical protein [Pseudomonadota bacterium]HQR03264.1 hypothetical protein [Rhodocyclaceae bacterium]
MLLVQVLLLAWLFTRVLPRRWHLVAAALSLLSLAPWGEVSPAMALRGLWGDPSITTVQLLVLALFERTPQAIARGWRGPAILTLIALVFYPLSLGMSDWDPYRLGYQPGLLVALLAVPALWAWWRGEALWLWLLAVDLVAWSAGMLESANLWDTLLDPLLAVALLILTLKNGWRAYKNRT